MDNAWSGIGAIATVISVVIATLSLFVALSGRRSSKGTSNSESSNQSLLESMLRELVKINQGLQALRSANTRLADAAKEPTIEDIIDHYLDDADTSE